MTNVALVFPGQGSQSVGMLSELANTYPIISHTFLEVSEILGYDLWDLTQKGPESQLNQTVHTQVVMLTADVALFRVLTHLLEKIPPSIMVGHSLGEYAALVCADALSLKDAAQLVKRRAEIMQETVPLGVGAMAAVVGLDNAVVEDLCHVANQQVSEHSSPIFVAPANYNAVGQVVVAGHLESVERLVKLAQDEGAKLAKLIPVSVPCHCDLLRPAAPKFLDVLNTVDFQTPKSSVLSSIDLTFYDSVPEMRKKLAEQLFLPVRWVHTIQQLSANGVNTVLECGPGRVLSGLIKRIDRTIKTYPLEDDSTLSTISQSL